MVRVRVRVRVGCVRVLCSYIDRGVHMVRGVVQFKVRVSTKVR